MWNGKFLQLIYCIWGIFARCLPEYWNIAHRAHYAPGMKSKTSDSRHRLWVALWETMANVSLVFVFERDVTYSSRDTQHVSQSTTISNDLQSTNKLSNHRNTNNYNNTNININWNWLKFSELKNFKKKKEITCFLNKFYCKMK